MKTIRKYLAIMLACLMCVGVLPNWVVYAANGYIALEASVAHTGTTDEMIPQITLNWDYLDGTVETVR